MSLGTFRAAAATAAVLWVGCDAPPPDRAVPADGSPVVPAAAEGLATWTVTSDASVLQEQRSLGPAAGDFFTRYPAAKIDPAAATPLKAASGLQLDGRPLLWLTPDRKGIVIDDRFSGDLEIVAVPTLTKDESRTVGRLTPAGRALPPRAVLEFLIRADVLRTYMHIEGTSRLTAERSADGVYEAEISGTHVFYTNARNENRFAFGFRIAADGEMSVRGR